MAVYMSGPELEAPPRRGSLLLGSLGALLGALIGAIPWVLVSTFTGFFVGWLGFLVGYAACLGYRALGGLRSTRAAMTVILLVSVLALLGADLASNMLVLCTDPGWQRSAARYGIPVARLAFDSLMMPENWHLILPNLLVGMLIGLLGVFSARLHVLKYTDPEKAAQLEAAKVPLRNAAPASTGLELP